MGESLSLGLSGILATGSAGTIAPENSIILTGNTATMSTGTITASGGVGATSPVDPSIKLGISKTLGLSGNIGIGEGG